MSKSVKLGWLSGRVVQNDGVTFGLPWPKGTLQRTEPLSLKTVAGKTIPADISPMAYWPDGSVKWTSVSANFSQQVDAQLFVTAGDAQNTAASGIRVDQQETSITVDTGAIRCRLQKDHPELIQWVTDEQGNLLCSGGQMSIVCENTSPAEGGTITRRKEYLAKATDLTVETCGKQHVVIKLSGFYFSTHEPSKMLPERSFMPFELRLSFYAGNASIHMIHTQFYNLQIHQDFIRSMGMAFKRPMAAPLYNRHVRLGGESGLFAESPKLLDTIRTRMGYNDKFEEQLKGHPLSFTQEKDGWFTEILDNAPVWNDFKVVQLDSARYTLYKRTHEGCTYIKGGTGSRAMGIAALGDNETGAMVVFLRDFWQKYPSTLEVCDAAQDTVSIKVWFWPEEAQAMDLRPYDTATHVASCYEGFDELRQTPVGMANTNQLTLQFTPAVPENQWLIDRAAALQNPALPVCDPQYYHACKIFGYWDVENRSTPERAYVEDKIDGFIQYYLQEREQRDWYGYWDYGDIRHTYDPIRHSWQYDIGGRAWQNTELMPNFFLWYAFLRSGREDIYRLAEAMTRHCSEVDVYHFGEYGGLGSRHNVLHWGCGCKECRISMAHNHKFLFYLTADERMGEILDEVKDSDFAVAKLDPLRAYYAPDIRFACHVRLGPDVQSFCSNWYAQWERHEDTRYRDKLLKTLAQIKKSPENFLGNPIWGYNPCGPGGLPEYFDFKIQGANAFLFHFGAQFIWGELAQDLEDQQLYQRFVQLGLLYSPYLPDREQQLKEWNLPEGNYNIGSHTAGLCSIAIEALKEQRPDDMAEYAKLLWRQGLFVYQPAVPLQYQSVNLPYCHKPLQEIIGISGNNTGSVGTNLIGALAHIGDMIPPVDDANNCINGGLV